MTLLPASLGTHSGAARIVSVRIRPMALAERRSGQTTVSLRALLSGERPAVDGHTDWRLEAYTEEIVASGFPGLRGLSGRPQRAQLDGYLLRIVDRDFEELGHQVRNPAALRRWMTAYAAASSTTTSFEKIATPRPAARQRSPQRRRRCPTETSSSVCGSSIRCRPGCRRATGSRGCQRRPSTSSPIRRSRHGSSASIRAAS